MFYVYIIRCRDNSLYTGYTTDVKKRMNEHFSKSAKGAKYTKSHNPTNLEGVWTCESKSIAMKLEYHIKRMSKKEKETFVESNLAPTRLAEKFLDLKIERIDISGVIN